ncbi:hypothetical protein B8A44_06245 [Dolosigranulum pigrum]|nr:hypothetical protein B8A31_06020 [Dolosigranulum pigrum]RAN52753.1 hypothetical protein B8A39_02290 [Dolosigranulum pigrum]RAN58304.1 hypothetical protein B8A40_05455 [Dolosigranulum pigrum]RAN58821.1 hypothetical protein B8A46_06755 [Dolosigranulum pigrum]RAN63079.1 hypothetical protein B8A44_06245 [Dolosigranulum pigrum]
MKHNRQVSWMRLIITFITAFILTTFLQERLITNNILDYIVVFTSVILAGIGVNQIIGKIFKK